MTMTSAANVMRRRDMSPFRDVAQFFGKMGAAVEALSEFQRRRPRSGLGWGTSAHPAPIPDGNRPLTCYVPD